MDLQLSPARAARPAPPRRPGLALALALALALGTGAPVTATPAAEPLPPHLDCWIAGVDDEGMRAYGIDPLVEPRCPSGRALDLRILRSRLGLP